MGTRKIVAIDPGRNTGIAIYGRELEYVNTLSINKTESFRDLAYRVAIYIEDRTKADFDLVYEGVQLYPNSPVPGNDLIDLSHDSGFMIGVIYQRSLPNRIKKYLPREWKGQVPKGVHNLRIFEQLDGLEQAKISDIPKGKQEHALDAVGLALFYKKQVDLSFR